MRSGMLCGAGVAKKPPGLRYSTRKVFDVLNHRGGRGYDAAKKVLGRKRHLVVNTLGLLLGVLVTPANVSDPAGAAQLLPAVVGRFGWLRHFWADVQKPTLFFVTQEDVLRDGQIIGQVQLLVHHDDSFRVRGTRPGKAGLGPVDA